jgi:2-C-methyl-D-erythritol 4-phosphate cytidylyltransferase
VEVEKNRRIKPGSSGKPAAWRRAIAVILCAGKGTRMGASQNKVFLPLLGKPMVLYSIEACQRARLVSDILLVAHPNEVDFCRKEILERYRIRSVLGVIPGGATRHQSEKCALDYLRSTIEGIKDPGVDVVLFHDGARPLVTSSEIDHLIQVARVSGGALLGTPLGDHEMIAELKPDGTVASILGSRGLWRAQTPQAFEAKSLLSAYDQAQAAGFLGTDTASTYERLGSAVHMVEGSRNNIKMTGPEDLLLGRALLRER